MQPFAVDGGAEALQALQAARDSGAPFQLILTDMHMPNMDGFDLVAHIRKQPDLSAATIMMLTSAGHSGDAERCRQLGVAAYLLKPIRQSELHEAIARVLGSREQSGAAPLVTRFVVQGAGETVEDSGCRRQCGESAPGRAVTQKTSSLRHRCIQRPGSSRRALSELIRSGSYGRADAANGWIDRHRHPAQA